MATRVRSTSLRRQSWQRITAAPSLDLRFAETKSLIDAVSGQNLITFSRASSGTYVGSDGLIKTATTNLLLRSEEFDNASWLKQNIVAFGSGSIANAIIAPNGTDTADLIVENTSNAEHFVYQARTGSNERVTLSVYAKAKERSRIRLAFSNFATEGRSAIFDLQNGTVVSVDAAGTDYTNLSAATPVPVGNGWYRCSFTVTKNNVNTTNNPTIGPILNTAINYTGDGTSGIYIWGAQLEQSSTVGEYIPTTSTINSAPRFDHNPTTGESLGLLVEEQRTNSIRNNTMVGAVAGTPGTLPTNWVASNLGTLSQQIVGTGTINGVQYIDWRVSGTSSSTSVTLGFEPTTQVVAASGESWSISAYAARVGGSAANIAYVGFGIYERTSAGSFVAANNSPTNLSNVTTFARVTYSATLAGGATVARVQPLFLISITSGAAIDITFRIGLPQLEQGAFATSVIPTSTTAVTRSADVASITGTNFSSWYRQDEGTVFASSALIASSYTSGVLWDVGASGAFGTTAYGAWSGTQWTLNPNIAPLNMFCTVTAPAQSASAYALKANDSSIAAAGLIGTLDASCAMPASATTLSIGKAGWTAGSNYFNGTIRRFTYWPARLSDANLRALTQ